MELEAVKAFMSILVQETCKLVGDRQVLQATKVLL